MSGQYLHRRSTNPATAFPSLGAGEIAANTPNRQIAVGDADSTNLGAPLPLLAIRFFDKRAKYAVGDFVVYTDYKIYRANTVVSPGAFNASQWDLMLPAQAAGGGASVFVGDNPPLGAPDNSLWWSSANGGLSIRYNDGTSTQWVAVAPTGAAIVPAPSGTPGAPTMTLIVGGGYPANPPSFYVNLPSGTGTSSDAQAGDVLRLQYEPATAGGGTPSAPTMTLTSAASDATPNFSVNLPPDALAGDMLRIQYETVAPVVPAAPLLTAVANPSNSSTPSFYVDLLTGASDGTQAQAGDVLHIEYEPA